MGYPPGHIPGFHFPGTTIPHAWIIEQERLKASAQATPIADALALEAARAAAEKARRRAQEQAAVSRYAHLQRGSADLVLPRPARLPQALLYQPRRRGPVRLLGRALVYLAIVCLFLDLAAESYFISLNWVNPPVTAYMLESSGQHLHDYVSLRYVSRYMIAATIAHEDAQLPTRFTGLDWDQWWSRVTAYLNHRKDPYGSPIPEQLAKNLLLWPSRNPLRKGLDAILAEQLIHAVSRQRVLELYLNEAQFGPHIYGVCDATWYYFGEPPDYMSWHDAYELMGVLPSPVHAHRLPGGGIDMNPATRSGRLELGLIRGAEIYVPRDLRIDGGLNLVRQMGIAGTAHAQPNGHASCRTMPQDIRHLIATSQHPR